MGNTISSSNLTDTSSSGTWGSPSISNIGLGSGNADSSVSRVLLENQHPKLCTVGCKITLKTFKGSFSNPQIVKEEYVIRPKFTGNYNNCENKINYISIGTSIYALKIYEPNYYSETDYNVVYCVPCIKDATYKTGYRDFTSSVTQGFKDAFIQYASGGIVLAQSTVQKKSFSFEFLGNLSSAGALQGTSQTFTFDFAYSVGGANTTNNN